MSSITITLPDDRLQQLKKKAAKLHLSPEELVQASVEDLLSRSEEDFERTLDYLLQKNADLYRQLA